MQRSQQLADRFRLNLVCAEIDQQNPSLEAGDYFVLGIQDGRFLWDFLAQIN